MSIFARYLLRRFFLTFFVAMICFIIVFDLVNLVENIGRFVESGAKSSDVALYYLYFTPFIVVLTCPIATLLSSIFSVGLLAKSNELTAMKAAGVSIYKIAGVLFLGGVAIAAGLWIFGEHILPEANHRKNIIKIERIEKRQAETASVYRNQMFQGLDGRIFQFANYISRSATGEDVVVQRFDGNQLRDIITVGQLVWRDTIWHGTAVTLKRIGDLRAESQPILLEEYDSLYLTQFREKPSYFEDWFARQDALSMSYFKLRRFIEVSRALGRSVTRQVVDLHNKVAFPFINVIIILIGVALASNPRRAGLGISFGLSMGVSFAFYTMVKIAIEMGHEGMLSPRLRLGGQMSYFFCWAWFC